MRYIGTYKPPYIEKYYYCSSPIGVSYFIYILNEPGSWELISKEEGYIYLEDMFGQGKINKDTKDRMILRIENDKEIIETLEEAEEWWELKELTNIYNNIPKNLFKWLTPIRGISAWMQREIALHFQYDQN